MLWLFKKRFKSNENDGKTSVQSRSVDETKENNGYGERDG